MTDTYRFPRRIALSARHTGLPMAEWPRVVYWSEREGNWWPGASRSCPSCIGGYLTATPPIASTPGWVSCIQCGREAAPVLHTRPPAARSLPDDGPPRLGRPPTRMGRPPGTFTAPRRRCRDCPTMIDGDHERCRDCHNAHRFGVSAHGRLVEILEDGEPRRRDELCEALDITCHALKNAIDRARKAGYPVVNHRRGVVRLQVAR